MSNPVEDELPEFQFMLKIDGVWVARARPDHQLIDHEAFRLGPKEQVMEAMERFLNENTPPVDMEELTQALNKLAEQS